MTQFSEQPSGPDQQPASPPQTIVIQQPPPRRGWVTRLLIGALVVSVLLNIAHVAGTPQSSGPIERFDSGDRTAEQKLAILEVSGMIMPPYTERIIETIETIESDDAVRGVLLVVDSPGGLVADSHQVYHRLSRLQESKPVYVAMKRLAASGGYYVAMGAGPDGRIFAEPTCWTGSIGVIIPRFNVSQLAERFGVESEPLTTGPFKDALSPFRELSDEERAMWEEILDDAFVRFKDVVIGGRTDIDETNIDQLANGQVFTAQQSLANGLIDEIGYEEDALEALKEHLGLADARIVRYEYPPTLLDVVLGTSQSRAPADPLSRLLESSVPRAMYLFGWTTDVPR